MRKFTKEEVAKKINEITNDEYILIGDYKNANTKITIKHKNNRCGYVWQVLPANFINKGTRCPKCNLENKKMTDKEFKEKLVEKYGYEYRALDIYVDTYKKIRVLHKKCGKVILKRPNDLLNGYGCNFCNKYRKKTDEEFKSELKDIYQDEYIALEEYENSHKSIYFKHKCGKVFSSKPYMMLQGKRKCPKCKKNPTPTEEEFREMIKKVSGNQYLLVTGYKNMNTKATFLHKKCEKTFEMKPTEFIVQGYRCIHCSGVKKYTTESFNAKVLELTYGEYVTYDKYKNNKTKVKMKHLECGYEWMVRPDQFLHGSRCPCCKKSNGNKKINTYLKNKDFIFIAEYRIEKCKNKRMLPFDFAIFNKNGDIELLIEYQGRQHYEVIEKFGGVEGYKMRIRNDEIKERFCKKNNIRLLAIPYTHYTNLEQILDKELKDINDRCN